MRQVNGGVREPSVITHEVLGGTGRYAGARGNVTIDNAPEPASVTIRLIGSADSADSALSNDRTIGSRDTSGIGLWMTTCCAPEEAGVTVLYEPSRRRIDLAGGSLFGVSTFHRPISIASDRNTEWMVVTGGTGDYAGAVGTVSVDRGDPNDKDQFISVRLLR